MNDYDYEVTEEINPPPKNWLEFLDKHMVLICIVGGLVIMSVCGKP